MSKILAVAWREFTQTVMRKVFLLAVVGLPLIFIGIMALAVMTMVNHEEPPLIGKIAIVDPTGEVSEAALVEFDTEEINRDMQREIQEQVDKLSEGGGGMGMQPGAMPNASFARGEIKITIEAVEATDEATIISLQKRILDKGLLAVAVIPDEILDTQDDEDSGNPTFKLYIGEKTDSDHVRLIERRIGEAVVRARAIRRGDDPDEILALMARPRAQTSRATDTGEFASESAGLREARKVFIPLAFMLLVWIGALTSSQHLMMSTIEEKSNRVMEVLLSAVSPLQLMMGKILGYGGVGLLIVCIYASVGIFALIMFALFTSLINPMDLVFMAVFFIMAYFMIAALMAAVGSAVSDIREANTLVMPVMMIIMVPLFLQVPIIEDPNGSIATIFSFVPPAIPFAMILRVAAEEPIPMWQYPASIIWGYACVFGMIWLAGKIFRVGVLMYGKPPSPLELIKWIRRA